MSTPQPPSAEQLAAARLAHWRQTAPTGGASTALLTAESARQFVSACGLLLFAPRPQHIASPAPSLVEATLGAENPAPSLAESAEARILLSRLIAEGSAVALNLLGAPSTTPDNPDFVASAATFPYIFTLRGDKAFKQPPATSGASKVSPLALNAYTLLTENGPTSAYDLATQLGKEVTEAAVHRSLNELWQHLRVLPVPQADGGATLWEPTANRFTKQIKAGANAGQPTALSALISLYLSQALLATETEIESFLSPLAPRSRVRDVLHALTGARQLETLAVEGKTHLHIHGELPDFSAAPVAVTSVSLHAEAEPAGSPVELSGDGTRIRKFVAKPRKVGTGYVERAKPFRGTGAPAREDRRFESKAPPREGGKGFAGRPAAKLSGKSSVDRRERPAFNRPWDEDKQQRPGRTEGRGADSRSDAPSGPRAGGASSPGEDRRFPKRPFGAKSRFGGGDRPAFSRGDFARPGASGREETGSQSSAQDATRPRPPRRDFSGSGKTSFGDRRSFAKPGFGDRKREGSTGRPFTDRPGPGARSDRRDRSPEGGAPRDEQRRPFRRDSNGTESRPPRRDFGGAESSSRPPRPGFSKPRTFREDAGAPGDSARPTFRKFDAPRGPRAGLGPREEGESRPPRRGFSGAAGSASSSRPPTGRSGRPTAPFSSSREGGSAGGRGAGSFAGKRDGGGSAGKKAFPSKSSGPKKPFRGKAGGAGSPDAPGASTFDKFKGGNKPWGKRPPGRKPKPDKGGA